MGVDRMETKELRQSNRNGARVGDIELVYIIIVMTRKESQLAQPLVNHWIVKRIAMDEFIEFM